MTQLSFEKRVEIWLGCYHPQRLILHTQLITNKDGVQVNLEGAVNSVNLTDLRIFAGAWGMQT